MQVRWMGKLTTISGNLEHFDLVLGQNSAKRKYSELLCIKF